MTHFEISSDEDAAFVEKEVRSGRFASANEVVSGALRALKDQPLSDQAKLEVLRRDLEMGLAQLDRHQSEPWSVETTLTRLFDRHQDLCMNPPC